MASPSSPPPESGNVAHDVEQRAARGGVVTAMGQATRAVASGAGTLLLMRLLTPSDFGLVGMIVAITGFFDLLKDFGLTSATVQRERIEHDEVSALFWINFAIGIALMLLNAAMAPVVALVYGRSELLPLTLALSTASALGALPLQHEALLRRELRFEPIAWIATTSAAAASIASVLAALGGLGAWALVVRQLVRLGVRASLLWIACRWRPSRPKRVNVRELVKFGAHVSGFQLTNYFERNFDNLLVGRFLGPQALGFYTKAYEVMR
ncbi:MAG: oligosaccharide flippase family protein, partial [Myxococcales bacterium]|nr:oligosaccharide flippase family protein [Myxococcales bacterium]